MHKSIYAASILFFCAFSLTFAQTRASTTVAESPNLLGNGSFEEGPFSSSAIPDRWSWADWAGTAQHIWDDEEAKAGAKSAKIIAPNSNDVAWTQSVDIQQNTPYYLSGWVKTKDVAHSTESVDLGANISLFGTWTHSQGVLGTQDWTPVGVLFNSESNRQVTVAARLGFWAGTTKGTAWFDDLRLTRLLPVDPHPQWKILVLIYRNTDFTYFDSSGILRHVVASMTQAEVDNAAYQASQFVKQDIPLLTSGNMLPALTIRYPDQALTRLSPNGDGWWPSPFDTAEDRDSAYDSVIVIWDPRATDQITGEKIWIGSAAGLTPSMGTGQTYTTLIVEATSYGHRNVFKHEWGHSILEFFNAIGTAPKPKVENHAIASQYVNCITGAYYIWIDETEANPIPNSIYNNSSGFTHDYYSGTTASAAEPTRCLGVTAQAWAFGGPVSNSAVYSARVPTITLKPPITLWPPNHKYVTLTTNQMVDGIFDDANLLSANDVVIEQVTSDEPDDVSGDNDGATLDDIRFTSGCKSVELRSERHESKNGRVYSITLRVQTNDSNAARAVFKVSVPIGAKKVAIEDAPALTVTSLCR